MDTNMEQPTRQISPGPAPQTQESASTTPSPPSFSRAMHRLRCWVEERTLAAPWIPHRLAQPLLGYLLGALLVVVLFLLFSLLELRLSDLPMATLLILLSTALTALAWGGGPSAM